MVNGEWEMEDKMIEQKLKTKDYLVAYIDVLGSKDKIVNDNDDEYLNKLKNIYDLTSKLFNTSESISENIKVNIFSDNIVIASEPQMGTSEEIDYSILNFFLFISFFQIVALGENFLLRGGITRGEFYIDKDFVWGKALLAANKLEEKIAIYPRIIIDSNALSLLDNFEYPNGGHNKFRLAQDSDGLIFLDYLYLADFFIKTENRPFLINYKYNFKKELEMYNGDSKIMQKLLWQKNYFNNFCANKEIKEFVVK